MRPPRSASRTRTSGRGCVPSSCSRAAPRSSEDDLKAHVKSHLANYKVPREIVFLDELPRNATGKVLKRELAEEADEAEEEVAD